MRQQRDEHASAREELQIRVSRQEAAITRLKDQLTEEKKYQNDLNGQTSALKSQLETAQAQISRLQDQLRKAEYSLKGAVISCYE
jgi:septal ring factor EnvC (AmiA/AmiB activator)